MTHVLVIANETAASQTLLDAVRSEASGADDRVTVIAPVNEPSQGYVVYEDTRRASAGRRLDKTLKALREGGLTAQGFVVETGPVQAARMRSHSSSRRSTRSSSPRTAPSGPAGCAATSFRSRARGEGAAGEARRRRAGVRRGERARRREPDRSLGRAARPNPEARCGGHRGLPDRRAAERRRGARDADRRLRRALSELRGEGIEAHGQVVHPDPYTAARQVVHDERVDEIIVSTFPGEKSGWLRRDLVGRLRKDTGLPVEHVISPVPQRAPVERV